MMRQNLLSAADDDHAAFIILSWLIITFCSSSVDGKSSSSMFLA
jgi:hypothetical protein